MLSVIEFMFMFAALQMSHVLVVAAVEPRWEHKSQMMLTLAIIIDALVLAQVLF